MSALLEIACFNYSSALTAAKAGADRIEFCVDYAAGGLTPDLAMVEELCSAISNPIYVMIRLRGGDFIYSKNELVTMKNQIARFQKIPIAGLVFGALNNQLDIDDTACKLLLDAAEHLPCTFHRAIDRSNDIFKSTERLINLGFKRILTSGAATNALSGLATIQQLQAKFGKQILILPGGGIRAQNIAQILKQTGCTEIHSAAIINKGDQADEAEIIALKQEINKLMELPEGSF